MKRLGFVVAGLAWFLLVFLVALRVTFPTDSLVERARYEVQAQSGGQLALEVASVGPWWAGVRATGVDLYRVGETEPVFHADVARARVAPTSLFGSPRIHGRLRFGEGSIDLRTRLDRTERGYLPGELEVEAEGFPISALPPIQGGRFVGTIAVEGTGGLDLDVDLSAPEGMSKAEGRASLYGRDLVVEELTGTGAILQSFEVLPLTIDELDLALDVTQGKARVVRGRIGSSLANLQVSGDVTLQDDLARSRFRLQAVLDLGEGAERFAGFLSDAKWSDDRYHYTISGTWPPSIRAERERGARREAAPAPRPAREAVPERTASPETIEAARAAREARRARLAERRAAARERREQREDPDARPMDPAIPVDPEEEGFDEEGLEDEEFLDEEPLPDEEPLLDEELPAGEEAPADEEF